MINPNSLPFHFRIRHKTITGSFFIEFHFTRGALPVQWNGYYKGWRLLLRYTEIEWIVEAVYNGKHLSIFRWPNSEPDTNDIEAMIDCCCYYIDSTGLES